MGWDTNLDALSNSVFCLVYVDTVTKSLSEFRYRPLNAESKLDSTLHRVTEQCLQLHASCVLLISDFNHAVLMGFNSSCLYVSSSDSQFYDPLNYLNLTKHVNFSMFHSKSSSSLLDQIITNKPHLMLIKISPTLRTKWPFGHKIQFQLLQQTLYTHFVAQAKL